MAKRILYVLLAVLIVVDVPWAEGLRFEHSSGEMAEFARTLGQNDEVRDVSLGLLSFVFVRQEEGHVVFYRGRGWDHDGWGYIWSPGHRPADTRHLDGPWYRFRDDAHM
ncbi:hypothetical protein FDA94_02790 [Herbidospora galbida]|uniref:Uncharacterized protein n=1 Tax=Herbidospora galbida TaxID=2575442 RepID=A0A4U3MT95_9ACTN|nr:hypothetical protein [Herbidospora galbida]TKK91716.1 hypothetical protein FDA94_02790 [Herbidospora galbida]